MQLNHFVAQRTLRHRDFVVSQGPRFKSQDPSFLSHSLSVKSDEGMEYGAGEGI
jgi:hypothetical protein